MENCRNIKPSVRLRPFSVTNLTAHCYYCDHIVKPIIDNERNHDSMTMDHIVPRSHGGPNHHNNRVIACFSCDTVKADGDAVEFAEAVKEYGRPGDNWGKRGSIRRWRKLTGYKIPKRTT